MGSEWPASLGAKTVASGTEAGAVARQAIRNHLQKYAQRIITDSIHENGHDEAQVPLPRDPFPPFLSPRSASFGTKRPPFFVAAAPSRHQDSG